MNKIEVMLVPLRTLLREVVDFLPRLALAIAILVIGWFVAKAAKFAVVKTLRAVNFHVVTQRAGLDGFLQEGGIESDTTAILGLIVYWLVILGALVIAFNSLGLVYVTDILGRVVLFVPRVLVALLILAFGGYFARFIGGAITAYCRKIRVQDADILGRLAQYAIVTFVVLIALDQVDIGGDIIRQSFLIVLAGIVFSLALAFGLGGRGWAADLLERWWPRRKR